VIPSGPGARPRVRVSNPQSATVPRLKIAVWVVVLTVVLVISLYGWHQLEQFLIHDSRFAVNGPDGAEDASVIQIQGAQHASRRAIEAAFADDLGRSIYLLPVEGRRATLRTVDWVKDATVARMWPNRVLVRVAERKPVAFVTLAASRYGLIDEDGVILPPATDRFHLPVLQGVHARDPLADRRDRVQRMQRLLRALGANAEKIAEVDVTDREDLRVTQPYDGRMVTLLLGDQNFAVRYQNFLNHYAEIREKMPGANSLDLRLEDRITVVEQKAAE
jgi:cell division protein FtsQ